jgi:hypothetical protein
VCVYREEQDPNDAEEDDIVEFNKICPWRVWFQMISIETVTTSGYTVILTFYSYLKLYKLIIIRTKREQTDEQLTHKIFLEVRGPDRRLNQ